MKRTMGLVGPAVFYGGLSTFLAFVLLANSSSYVFRVFFRVGERSLYFWLQKKSVLVM